MLTPALLEIWITSEYIAECWTITDVRYRSVQKWNSVSKSKTKIYQCSLVLLLLKGKITLCLLKSVGMTLFGKTPLLIWYIRHRIILAPSLQLHLCSRLPSFLTIMAHLCPRNYFRCRSCIVSPYWAECPPTFWLTHSELLDSSWKLFQSTQQLRSTPTQERVSRYEKKREVVVACVPPRNSSREWISSTLPMKASNIRCAFVACFRNSATH